MKFLALLFSFFPVLCFGTEIDKQLEDFVRARIENQYVDSISVSEEGNPGDLVLSISVHLLPGAYGRTLQDETIGGLRKDIENKFPDYTVNYGIYFPFSMIITDINVKSLSNLSYKKEIEQDIDRHWKDFGVSIQAVFEHSIYGYLSYSRYNRANFTEFLGYAKRYVGEKVIVDF